LDRSSNIGFLVKINASIESCGGVLAGSTGTVQSPGYPHGYPHRIYCSWVIEGPANRRIQLTFEDFDLEPPLTSRNHCAYDAVYVSSGSLSRYKTPAFEGRPSRCGSQTPDPVSSTSNIMQIGLKSDGSVSHRGFKATWTSDEPALCGGDVAAQSGIISSPMTSNFTYPNRLLCHWTIRSRSNLPGTLKFTIPSAYLEDGCHDTLSFLRGQTLDTASSLKYICGDQVTTSNPAVVLSPGLELTHVIFRSDNTITARGFNVTYQFNECGGTFHGPLHVISSSGTNMDCAWLLDFEPGQQIDLSRFSLVMDNSGSVSCGDRAASFVTVRNGGEPDSPILWKGCGNTQVSLLL